MIQRPHVILEQLSRAGVHKQATIEGACCVTGIQRWVGVVSLKRLRRCSHDVLLRDLTQVRADLGDIVDAERLGTWILEDLVNESGQDHVRIQEEDFLIGHKGEIEDARLARHLDQAFDGSWHVVCHMFELDDCSFFCAQSLPLALADIWRDEDDDGIGS